VIDKGEGMKSLAEIEKDVGHLAAQIGASVALLPTYGAATDGTRPHIEVDSLTYHYVVVERGEELRRTTTRDYDDLLYYIFADVTFNLACAYELANRIENQDYRRIGFEHQIKLLSKISKKWSEREFNEHEKILHDHPFDDASDMRVQLSKELGWAKACEKYPLPTRTG
jgi:hypothetical protein